MSLRGLERVLGKMSSSKYEIVIKRVRAQGESSESESFLERVGECSLESVLGQVRDSP